MDYLYAIRLEDRGQATMSQCVEERNADTDAPSTQYIWGVYIDELIQMRAYD